MAGVVMVEVDTVVVVGVVTVVVVVVMVVLVVVVMVVAEEEGVDMVAVEEEGVEEVEEAMDLEVAEVGEVVVAATRGLETGEFLSRDLVEKRMFLRP